MTDLPRASIIVLAWNGEKYLDACLRAVLAQTDETVEVLVVDNASTDGSAAIARNFAPRVTLIQNETNLGFAGGNNVGIKAANGEVVILLNQDTVVQPGWLAAILETFPTDPAIGIVGCKALYPDGKTIQHAGARVRPGTAFTEHIGLGELDEGRYDQLADMDYVTGASFAIHRRVLERLGELDEGYYPAFYEEVDYCYCARRAGFRVVYQPRAKFHHYETTSFATQAYERISVWHRHRLRFVLRHWSAEQLRLFIQAEQQALGEVASEDEAGARYRAYFDGLLALPAICRQRQTNAMLGALLTIAQERGLIESFLDLRRRAIEQLRKTLGEPPTSYGMPDTSRLVALALRLKTQAEWLEDPAPQSPVPILGPLVTRIRAFWLATFVRPYLIPLVRHQSEHNRQVAEALLEAAHRLEITRYWVDLLSADDQTVVAFVQRDARRRPTRAEGESNAHRD